MLSKLLEGLAGYKRHGYNSEYTINVYDELMDRFFVNWKPLITEEIKQAMACNAGGTIDLSAELVLRFSVILRSYVDEEVKRSKTGKKRFPSSRFDELASQLVVDFKPLINKEVKRAKASDGDYTIDLSEELICWLILNLEPITDAKVTRTTDCVRQRMWRSKNRYKRERERHQPPICRNGEPVWLDPNSTKAADLQHDIADFASTLDADLQSVFWLLLGGHTVEEIAEKRGRSRRTINRRIDRLTCLWRLYRQGN